MAFDEVIFDDVSYSHWDLRQVKTVEENSQYYLILVFIMKSIYSIEYIGQNVKKVYFIH
jgi:hypothetical protein